MASFDALVLIHSDSHGNPDPTHRIGYLHGVRFKSDRSMTVPNQMKIGGRFPNDDCLDALSKGVIWDYRGVTVAGTVVEEEEHTGPGGTYMPNVVTGLAVNGVASHDVKGNPQGALWGGNPAWGGIIPPQSMGPYYASLAGEMAVIDAVGAATATYPIPAVVPVTTSPPPMALGAQEMIVGPFIHKFDNQVRLYVLGSDEQIYEAWGASAAEAFADLDLGKATKVQSDISILGGPWVKLTGQQQPNGDVLLIAARKDGTMAFDLRRATDGGWYGATNVAGFNAYVG